MEEACDVVIVNFNAGSYLLEAVRTARNASVVQRIIVVDNASTDSSLETLGDNRIDRRLHHQKRLQSRIWRSVQHRNSGRRRQLHTSAQSGLPGSGRRYRKADIGASATPSAGMAGPLLLNSNGTEQAGGRRVIPTPGRAFSRGLGLLHLRRFFPRLLSDFALHEEPLPENPVEVEAISGACMLVSRAAVNKVGLFDEKYFLHCEDLDWCVRFHQSGYSIMFVPDARVVHEKGVSSVLVPSQPSITNTEAWSAFIGSS